MHLVDISEWIEDKSNSPYPEGARDKVAYISPENPSDELILGGHRYLLKFSNDRYPSQYWAEVIAAEVAELMGVSCPKTHLALHPKTGQPGSLVSWFYGEELESEDIPPQDLEPTENVGADLPIPDAPSRSSYYVSGGSYMTRMIENYDLKKGTQHNLRSLSVLLTHFRREFGADFWPHWFSVFAFDALIGNTDRHQDNWGVLWRRWGGAEPLPRFSPAFDNGTSLLHEIHDKNLSRMSEPDRLRSYVDRGTHHIKYRSNDGKKVNHVDLLAHLLERRDYLRPFGEIVFAIDLSTIQSKLANMTLIDLPHPLSEERAQLIFSSLEMRLQNIRSRLEL